MISKAVQAGLEPELIRNVVDQAPDAIIVTDDAGAIRIWNMRAASNRALET
jgi:hypothetical protein